MAALPSGPALAARPIAIAALAHLGAGWTFGWDGLAGGGRPPVAGGVAPGAVAAGLPLGLVVVARPRQPYLVGLADLAVQQHAGGAGEAAQVVVEGLVGPG